MRLGTKTKTALYCGLFPWIAIKKMRIIDVYYIQVIPEVSGGRMGQSLTYKGDVQSPLLKSGETERSI